MKTTAAFLFLIVMSISSSYAETFSKGRLTVKAYPLIAYHCAKGNDLVTYTYHDNQSEKGYGEACALTYRYAKCPGTLNDSICDQSFKTITKEKLLWLSNVDRNSCLVKGKELVKKLEAKKFKCSETGIN